VLGPDPDGPPRGDPQGLQVLGVQGQRAHDRLVLVVLLADVDLLALLAGPAGVHDEAFPGHRPPPSSDLPRDPPESPSCTRIPFVRIILVPLTPRRKDQRRPREWAMRVRTSWSAG